MSAGTEESVAHDPAADRAAAEEAHVDAAAVNRVRPYQPERPGGKNWPDVLTALVEGWALDPEALRWAMTSIFTGTATQSQTAALMVALRAKGEDAEDLTLLVEVLMEQATAIELTNEAVDVVGTGGDRKNTVNISTMASIIAAAAGARVIKHGNRAASSKCGTADVLEELGVALELDPAKQQQVLDEVGIVFLFAPLYHSSMRHAGAARKELGIPTVFNILGPLANPAQPRAQALGVAHEPVAELMAEVMAARGTRGMVFYGNGGLDELSTANTSRVFLVNEGRTSEQQFDPATLGIPAADLDDLVGGEPALNAKILRETLGGATGPVRDIVLLNAAAAMLCYQGPDPDADLADQLRPLLEQAAAVVDDGRALRTLDRWVAVTQQLAQN